MGKRRIVKGLYIGRSASKMRSKATEALKGGDVWEHARTH